MNNNWLFQMHRVSSGSVPAPVTDEGTLDKLTVIPVNHFARVYNEFGACVKTIRDQVALDVWLENEGRAAAWKPEIEEPLREFKHAGPHTLKSIKDLHNKTKPFLLDEECQRNLDKMLEEKAVSANSDVIVVNELAMEKTLKDITGSDSASSANYSATGSASHYKDIVPGFQYIEMMQFMLAKFSGIEAHLLGTIYGYLMRNGNKDDSKQEMTKVLWYMKFYLAWLRNDKQPIKIADIPALLGEV